MLIDGGTRSVQARQAARQGKAGHGIKKDGKVCVL